MEQLASMFIETSAHSLSLFVVVQHQHASKVQRIAQFLYIFHRTNLASHWNLRRAEREADDNIVVAMRGSRVPDTNRIAKLLILSHDYSPCSSAASRGLLTMQFCIYSSADRCQFCKAQSVRARSSHLVFEPSLWYSQRIALPAFCKNPFLLPCLLP